MDSGDIRVLRTRQPGRRKKQKSESQSGEGAGEHDEEENERCWVMVLRAADVWFYRQDLCEQMESRNAVGLAPGIALGHRSRVDSDNAEESIAYLRLERIMCFSPDFYRAIALSLVVGDVARDEQLGGEVGRAKRKTRNAQAELGQPSSNSGRNNGVTLATPLKIVICRAYIRVLARI